MHIEKERTNTHISRQGRANSNNNMTHSKDTRTHRQAQNETIWEKLRLEELKQAYAKAHTNIAEMR